MASAYVLPLDRGSHVYGHHGHGHSRSHQNTLRPERSSSWLSQINEAAVKKTPSANSLRGQSLSDGQLHTDSQALAADSFEPNESRYNMQNFSSKSRPRGESDLMRPPPRPRAASNAYGIQPVPETPTKLGPWVTVREALTAVLIPLPYLFASLAYPPISTNPEQPNSPFERLFDPAPEAGDAVTASHIEPAAPSALLQACCLASGTLLLAGLIGGLNSSERVLDRRKRDLGGNKYGANRGHGLVGNNPIRRIIARLLSVGLPYYAAMQLGGARTSFVLLTTIGSGLTGLNISPLQPYLLQAWQRIASVRKLTCAVLILSFMLDLSGLARGIGTRDLLLGHMSLAFSVLFFPPPLPSAGLSMLNTPNSGAVTSTSTAQTLYDNPKASSRAFPLETLNPLVSSGEDVRLTLISGGLLSMATVAYAVFASTSPSLSFSSILFTSLSMCSALGLIFLSSPSSLRSPRKVGVGLGYVMTICFGYLLHSNAWKGFMALGVLSCLSYMAVWSDTVPPVQSARVNHHRDNHHQAHDHLHSHSRISGYFIALCTPGSILHSILIEKDSRRIAYFACLNLGFMIVQFFYGFASGSLGLLTDSIHMLFDCLGLAVGLAAAVMTKRPPNFRFPYGYGKIDTLSGFANGIFLMLVSVEIVFDAFEKLYEGHEMHRLNELLIVSVLGLIVNIIGLTAFGHAHHGHDHGHSHGDHSHHDNENMHGIFLHILADTLGSAAVIVSTILTKWTGWAGWDPIASTIIAVLIAVSAYPLVKSSGMRLLLSLPADVEYKMRTTLQEISSLRGVVGYTVPKFWMEDAGAAHADAHSHGHTHSHAHGRDEPCQGGLANGHVHEHGHDSDHGHNHSHNHSHGHDHGHSQSHDHSHDHQPKVLGVIHIIASRTADVEDVQERTVQFLKGRGMDVVVHVEREGEGWCWCGAGTNVGG